MRVSGSVGGSSSLHTVHSADKSSQFEWRVFLLEGDICTTPVWLEKAPPGIYVGVCVCVGGLPSIVEIILYSCEWYILSMQACVKERASKSMACVRDMTVKEARVVVEQVFETCFADTDPFERVPP